MWIRMKGIQAKADVSIKLENEGSYVVDFTFYMYVCTYVYYAY